MVFKGIDMLSRDSKNKIRENIKNNGYAHISSDKYDVKDVDFFEFSHYWSNLIKDEYLHDNGGYRYRRCGMYSLEEGVLENIKVKGWYYQSSNLNKINGGKVRKFGPLEEGFIKNPIINNLILTLFDSLPLTEEEKKKKWRIYVHPFRIIAKKNQKGEASPEGPHRDGHQYTAQLFVQKNKVVGATSRLFNSDMLLVKENNFSTFLETLILDDEVMFHDVTSLETDEGQESGYRDIFTINFNLFDKSLASIME